MTATQDRLSGALSLAGLGCMILGVTLALGYPGLGVALVAAGVALAVAGWGVAR